MAPPPKPWEAAAAAQHAQQQQQGSGSISFSPGPGPGPHDASAADSPGGSSSVGDANGGGPLRLSLPADRPAPPAAPSSPLRALNGGGARRPASIYEAATLPQDAAPSIIAGRLSPTKSPQAYPAPSVATALFTDDEPGAYSAGPHAGGRAHASSAGTPDGAGLGRPASRGWKPPPMPAPTLSSSRGEGGGVAHSGSARSLGEDFSSA
jgi:hypothetical protein